MSNTSWIIVLSILVIVIFTILTIIRANKRGVEMDWAMLKFWESKEKDEDTKPKPRPSSKPWLGTALGWTVGLGLILLVSWFVWSNRFSFMPDDRAERKTDSDCCTMEKEYYKTSRFEFTGKKYKEIRIGHATFEYYVEGGTLEGRDKYNRQVVLDKADVPLIGASYSSMSLRPREKGTVILVVNYYKLKKVKC